MEEVRRVVRGVGGGGGGHSFQLSQATTLFCQELENSFASLAEKVMPVLLTSQ